MTLLEPTALAEIVNRDTGRIIANFNEVEKEVVIEGPPICLKTTRSAFMEFYPGVVATLKKVIRKQLEGQRYRVKEIKFKILEDAEKNYWGDFGRHYATVEIYTDMRAK